MKKHNYILLAAVFASSILTAQNSRIVSIGNDETPFEKKFSDNTPIKAPPYVMLEKPDLFKQFNNQQKTAIKRDLMQYDTQRKNNVSVKKSSRDDVATVTLRVIGDPLSQYNYENGGFQLLIDKERRLYDDYIEYLFNIFNVYRWEHFVFNPNKLYDNCKYTIPKEISFDIFNNSPSNTIIDGEESIDITEGFYNFVIVYFANDNFIQFALFNHFGNRLNSALFDNFFFKAGYEYEFEIDESDVFGFDDIKFSIFNEQDIGLKEIILPPVSTELTEEEEVTVVIVNDVNHGFQNITGDIELSYRINEGEWITPETLSVQLSPGEEITYTFNTKADFSEGGLYNVEAWVNFDSDLWSYNDFIKGYTKNPVPLELPFYEDFTYNDPWYYGYMNNYQSDLFKYWTVLDLNEPFYSSYFWRFGRSYGSDGQLRSVVSVIPYNYIVNGGVANAYLISDPINISEAGTYNISFIYLSEHVRSPNSISILYGTSSNPEEMEILDDYQLFPAPQVWMEFIYNGGLFWTQKIKNFEIETPGTYYFAFHDHSQSDENNVLLLNIDNIKIAQGDFFGEPDINFNNLLVPVSNCEMSDENVIGAKVFNRGTADINEFTLTYQINDDPPVSQTFNEIIGIKEYVTVFFDETADFSETGDYFIKFTASTPGEINVANNKADALVRHYKPITELPYYCDFKSRKGRHDWHPEVLNAWTYNDMSDMLSSSNYMYSSSEDGIPLLSRCITLEPDIYRLTYKFWVGNEINQITYDFYLTYGKSGTDPHTWEPVKIYQEHLCESIEEDVVMVEITEVGEYIFAFFPVRTSYNEDLNLTDFYIFDFLLEVAPAHDLKFEKVLDKTTRITPKYHIEGEKTFTTTIQNTGATANESGNIKLLLNNNVIATQDFAFSASGETLNVDINPVFDNMTVGRKNLRFEATIADGISKNLQMFKVVSDSTFAWDNVDNYFDRGISLNVTGGIGLIYELQKSDILTSITSGFLSHPAVPANLFVILAVYEVNENYELGNMLFEKKVARTAGNNVSAITYDVPDIELQTGKYFFEVRQLDLNPMILVNDKDPNGYFYAYIPQDDFFGQIYDYGYLHVRPNFGFMGQSGIEELQVASYDLQVYPNPAKGELRVENGEVVIDKIAVYNAAGHVVLSFSDVNATSFSINTWKLSAGLYFISVQTKNGVVNEKFVVK